MADTPSAFSVSHYVLLFIVSTLCTISVVWVLVAANNRESAIRDNMLNRQINADKSCQRQVADKITSLWKLDPQKIPAQYIKMEIDYSNRVVPIQTTGVCNGQRFTCKMGEIRSVCDPCAISTAKKRALFQHISDAIDQVCKRI